MTMITSEVEQALDRHSLQVLGRNGRWYDVRRNGTTKRWKRDPYRVEIPCKVGLREAFRLCGSMLATTGGMHWSEAIRVRPDGFDSRTRA